MSLRARRLTLTVLTILLASSALALAGSTEPRRLAPAHPAARGIGSDVAIADDVLAVGAHVDREAGRAAGAVYLFRKDGSEWRQDSKLMAPGAARRDHFGRTLAMAGDIVAVGAPLTADSEGRRVGAAHVFERSGDDWIHVARLIDPEGRQGDNFGDALAVSGDLVAVGSPRSDRDGRSAGAVHVFRRGTDGVWALDEILTSPVTGPGGSFGASVALDRRRLLVGAETDQVAYLFRRRPRGWTEITRFDGNDVPGGTVFGRAVALDARHLAIGDPRAFGRPGLIGSGMVRVYRRQRREWILDAELFADVPSLGAFGVDVALEGRRLLVGAPDDAGVVSLGGQGQLFRRRPAGWKRVATYEIPELEWPAQLGRHLDLDRGRALLSATGDRTGPGRRKGAAWLFR